MKPVFIYIMVLLPALSGCKDNQDAIKIPEIIGIIPTMGYAGDEVVIEGAHFSTIASENVVRFGSQQAEVLTATTDQLKVVVPDGAADGLITVRVDNHTGTSVEEFVVLIDLDKAIELAMNTTAIPSAAFAAVVDGELYYTKGYGHYDASKSKSADQNTLYLTSSISKLMVAIAVMQQVDKGLVLIDNDISEYVGFEVRNPNFPDHTITVKMVMQHGSSLSNPVSGEIIDDVFEAIPPDSAVALHPIIEEAISPRSAIYNEQIWMNVAPGSFHKNSNYGITLLGYMVEKITGQHFNDYSKQHILVPLGMTASSYHYPDIDETKAAAIFGADGSPFDPFAYYFYPAGMLRTSTKDWTKVLLMMMNDGTLNGQKILSPTSVDALLNVKTPQGNNLAYGSDIGLVWRQAAGSTGWIGHTGAGVGVTHVTEINRDKNIGYVLFTNRVNNGQVVGPGGTLYSKIHRWLDQIELLEPNNN